MIILDFHFADPVTNVENDFESNPQGLQRNQALTLDSAGRKNLFPCMLDHRYRLVL